MLIAAVVVLSVLLSNTKQSLKAAEADIEGMSFVEGKVVEDTFGGGVVGYGVYLLMDFLVRLSGHDLKEGLNTIEEVFLAAFFVIIFGLIFFRLTPALKNQSKKVANDIETDLQKMSANDLVLGTIGLIAGLIIAFLISRI